MRVLITGGTGFFGKAMTRRLQQDGHSVCILSRDEAKQAAMAREFDDVTWMVGDVRDRRRVRRAMRGCDLVIHAAALKRIEVGARNPTAMVETNVLGTQHVCEEAEDQGIRCVVLSTDKAHAPISPYGQSKALAESIALTSKASVVRYGNVWRSTGSVVPTWEAQLERQAYVTVTDPRCTRFMMYDYEAVDLVLAAANTMPTEVLIPQNLPAYQLSDLAEAMGAEMHVTGLPPWEKLHENMDAHLCSETARRMTVDELREALANV